MTPFERIQIDGPVSFVGSSGLVLVLSQSRGRSPNGLEVDVKTAEIQELRDGRILRTVSYPTRSEALELLGLT